jgi:hypothetical protein
MNPGSRPTVDVHRRPPPTVIIAGAVVAWAGMILMLMFPSKRLLPVQKQFCTLTPNELTKPRVIHVIDTIDENHFHSPNDLVACS